MEVDRAASDSENVAADENVKQIADGGAGDATGSHTEKLRRKNKKYTRSNSKEGTSPGTTPLPKYRSWKNSRRPRNGHGRGLPKKGELMNINTILFPYTIERSGFCPH